MPSQQSHTLPSRTSQQTSLLSFKFCKALVPDPQAIKDWLGRLPVLDIDRPAAKQNGQLIM